MKVPKKVLAGHRVIWGGTIPPGALEQLKKEYARMPSRKRKNSAAGSARIIAAAKKALARHQREAAADLAAYRAEQKKQGTTGAVRLNPRRGLNLNPLRRVMKEAGVKRVRVMRSKSGKPVGLKFL